MDRVPRAGASPALLALADPLRRPTVQRRLRRRAPDRARARRATCWPSACSVWRCALLRVGAAVRVADLVTAAVRAPPAQPGRDGCTLTASLASPAAAFAAERPVEPPPVMRLIDEAPAPPAAAPAPAPARGRRADTYEVRPGQNLWRHRRATCWSAQLGRRAVRRRDRARVAGAHRRQRRPRARSRR